MSRFEEIDGYVTIKNYDQPNNHLLGLLGFDTDLTGSEFADLASSALNGGKMTLDLVADELTRLGVNSLGSDDFI